MTPESVVQIFVGSKRRSGETNGSSRFLLIPSLADQCCDPLSCQTALSSLAGRCGQIAAQTRVASARAPRGRRQEVSPPLKFPGLVVFSEGRHPRNRGAEDFWTRMFLRHGHLPTRQAHELWRSAAVNWTSRIFRFLLDSGCRSIKRRGARGPLSWNLQNNISNPSAKMRSSPCIARTSPVQRQVAS
jgi:hypothetical protein